jgi:integrase
VARLKHHAAPPWAANGTFMAELGKETGTAAPALRLAILPLARTTEVIGVTWAEIDMQAAIWTVPDERMKAGKERRVPLSEPVLAVLREIAALRQSDAPDAALLPSGKGGKSSKALSIVAMLMLLRRMGRGALTVHGFRSSFRDWAADISVRRSKPRLPTRSSRRWKLHIAAREPIREAAQADERPGDVLRPRRTRGRQCRGYAGRGER